MVYSLDMCVEVTEGQWFVWFASEDKKRVSGEETWEQAYWSALRRKHGVVESGR